MSRPYSPPTFLPFLPLDLLQNLRCLRRIERNRSASTSVPLKRSASHLVLAKICRSFPISVLLPLTISSTALPNSALPLGLTQGLLSECPPSTITCVSSQDDFPTSFLEPWEYDEPCPVLLNRLLDLVLSLPHSSLVAEQPQYLRFEIQTPFNKVDDLEFFFPDDDRVVHFRSARRDGSFEFWANRRRLEHIRQLLGLEQVPVLRNRTSKLGLFETPFDSFGPSAVDVDAIIGNHGIGSRAVR